MSLRTYRKWLAFGSGVGIEIGPRDLHVTVVQVRPSGARVLASHFIERYNERPASEWGGEYDELLKRHAVTYVAATVLLPRQDVIVRQMALPGVAEKDLAQAVAFQIDGLHPYNENDAVYDFARLDQRNNILIGIARRETVDQYVAMFAEAGIKVASFTFSAAAIYGAIRLFGVDPEGGFLAVDQQDDELEAYGESEARPVFSAVFDIPSEAMGARARGLALSELRLAPETSPRRLADVLPPPVARPEGYDVSVGAVNYASALASACGRLFPSANLLPPELRVNTSRAMYIPAAVLGSLLVLGLIGLFFYSKWEDRRYQLALEAEIKRLEPAARKPQAIERQITITRQRAQLIDNFRRRTTADLDVLNELTRVVPTTGWVTSAEIVRDQIRINGEVDQAAGLVRALDKSPAFENSEFAQPLNRTNVGEVFSIRGHRKGVLP